MIYLDTNAVLFISTRNFEKISAKARTVIDESTALLISPIVTLELQYLFEIKKISKNSAEILSHLEKGIGLKQCNGDFSKIIAQAIHYDWTRDPFDRIITATAAHHKADLITSDQHIAQHYSRVIW